MKHGVASRKFSRTSSHRMLMLRNLVTSLIQHEQIKTTLPKAKDTARLAEKIITLGKKGDLAAYKRANAFILTPQLVPKIFGTLAKRYSQRPGGYTRIHKFGNRPGDNAPHAILELVDNPRDLKFEMTARAVGWELLGKRMGDEGPQTLVNTGIEGVENVIKEERTLLPQARGELRSTTRWNLQKVLKFRSAAAITELSKKAEDHVDTLLAKPLALKEVLKAKSEEAGKAAPALNLRLKPGQTLPGGLRRPLSLAQGSLGHTPETRPWLQRRRKMGVDKVPLWNNL